MSNERNFLSPQNIKRGKVIFPQYNFNFQGLEKQIFKLINYLRINPEKYLNEFNKYFQKEELDKIITELNNLNIKLFPFDTKKEISNAGNDYLDYLIEKAIDKPYFNFYNIDKTCFNLRERLSKYGQRYGKIFESVIINSKNSEEIVNKLIKDEKSRRMILSPNMKYIAITCGFLPKWNNVCTIIDIVQDFIAYKDLDNISLNNGIQIINTIDFDEEENNFENKNQEFIQTDKLNDDLKSKYCSKTCKAKNKLNIDIDNKNNKFVSIDDNKSSSNYILSRNYYNKKFNSTISEKSKLISPLATYKSDAHLIFNQTHSNLQKSFFSIKRDNSYIYNNNEGDLTTKSQINMISNNYRQSNDLLNEKKKYENKSYNKIQDNLKKKKYNNSTQRVKEKEKLEIIHSLNEIKNKLIKEKGQIIQEDNSKNIILEKNKFDEKNKQRESNITLKNIGINEGDNKSRNNEISKLEEGKNEINNNISKNENDNINYNISFDNNAYSFVSKDNQNSQNTVNDNDNLLLTIEQINNTSIMNQNKKHNSFFSHDTEINNILNQKEKNINQKKFSIINNKIMKQSQENNDIKTDNKKYTFKIDKNNNNKKDFRNDSEDLLYHKNKKEIKKLIREYNKERYELKMRMNDININKISNINNNINNNNENNNNDGNNKKSTATFFYINKDNIKENKIKVYRKQKINISNSQNKFIKTNKNKLYDNNSHKNIKVKRYFFPKPIINKNNNHHKIVNNNSNNILLTDYNNNRNIDNVDYNINNGKKRICSYKASFSKLFKNRSYNNVLTESNCKNIEEKQYLSDKNINDAEDLLNSPKRTIKRVSNGNDNRETNVNSDNNNDLFDEIIKLNGYKYNKKGLKEIKINYIYNNRINYNTYKENYIYKRNKVKPEKKYSFKNYNKGPKNMKTDNNYYKISNINQNKSKKNYIIPYIKTID